MRRWRARAALASLGTSAALVLMAGCAGLEGLDNEGRARDVKAPLPLWPDYSPAPLGRDENPAVLAPVPGVPRIPSGDMADADASAVLDASVEAEGRTPPDPKAVRRPVLHDLTDDGKPDLITVVDLDPRNSELRVFSVRDQVVTRILALRGVLAGVELAAGHLAIREPTKDQRYVSVTDYVWDGDSMGLWDLTLDEARKPPYPSGAASPSAATATPLGGSPPPGLSPGRQPSPGLSQPPEHQPSLGHQPSPGLSPPRGGGS
ncbi:hypothetical protein [Streptomyces piniterrae]|uniref:hypothetical protein n=1 Tax=Streptomyces piniterrae TaxID=2571125 RepID=UPI001FEB5B7B|nr:hypothetical protein [Streptomyces piniterrae]